MPSPSEQVVVFSIFNADGEVVEETTSLVRAAFIATSTNYLVETRITDGPIVEWSDLG